MKRLGVIANVDKPRAAAVLQRLRQRASALGLDLLADEKTAPLLGAVESVEPKDMFERVEAVMAVGGDGTMLRVVRELDGREKPVIGLNIGGLGFLTSVSEGEIDRALECLASDNITVGLRVIAECILERNGTDIASYRALNDVVVRNGPSSRVVSLDLFVNGDKVTSYVCDGMIVSTPTGSTGHSLSAGGPILIPETAAFVVSLICPHTLSSRPLVVPDSSEIRVAVSNAVGPLLLSVDGQVGRPLEQTDAIRVRRSGRNVRFIHLPGYSYSGVLRQKLGWKGSSV